MFNHCASSSLALLSLTALTSASVASRWKYLGPALDATSVLNSEWYSPDTGRWQDLWWNSGSITTTLANLVSINTDALLPSYDYYFETTYRSGGDFINEFYDDEGWWALAWIQVYDLTSNETYLQTAEKLFEDMTTAKGATCGGLWWKKERQQNNAITNALYLQVAAALANRVTADTGGFGDYCSEALGQADWILNESGLVNPDGIIADSLDTRDCEPRGPNFTYNSGVTIAGLLELYAHVDDEKYLDSATSIAKGVLDTLTDDEGILTEPTYPNDLDSNLDQFKGIFARSLAALHAVKPDEEYARFLRRNADAIMEEDGAGQKSRIGPHWQGPVLEAGAASHASGLDCLVAAAAVS